MKKQNKGITLIALVITIIVLLILAGVTIATLTGENGILTQAGNAKTETTKAEAEEEFALIANEWMIEKSTGSKTLEELVNEKVKKGKITNGTDNGDGTYTLELNGYKKIINQNGKLSDVFDAEEWDKTATLAEYFEWDETGKIIIGYKDSLSGNEKIRIPSKCIGIEPESEWCSNFSTRSIISGGVKKIELPETIEKIGNFAFCEFKDLKQVNIPNSVISIGNAAFSMCTNLTNVEIPSSVISIESAAFYGCSNLTSVNLPEKITSIENATFEGCTNLTKINIPANVTSIGNNAFAYCTNLVSIKIPNSINSIGNNVFWDCSGITSVIIPSSVMSLGQSTFGNWTSDQTINIQGYSSAPEGWDEAWNSECSAQINWNQ